MSIWKLVAEKMRAMCGVLAFRSTSSCRAQRSDRLLLPSHPPRTVQNKQPATLNLLVPFVQHTRIALPFHSVRLGRRQCFGRGLLVR